MASTLARLHEEHQELWKGIEAIKETADLVELASPEAFLVEVEEARIFLFRHLIPHAQAEESVLYRAYDQVSNSPWATDTMRHDHATIVELARELSGDELQLTAEPATPEQKQDLRRILYGLYALLKAHFAKEEELLLPRLEAALDQPAADRLLQSLDETMRDNVVGAGW